jgi:hypothetical protein
MEISILGFKLNLEVLILIGIVYLILVIHTFCGCTSIHCKREGMDGMDGGAMSDMTPPPPPDINAVSSAPKAEAVPAPSSANATSGSSKKAAAKEGFVGANTNYGESASYPLMNSTYLNTSKWGSPNITIVPGKPIPKAAQAIVDRPNQSLPLPEGQLSLFDNMPFSPKCCPNTYSSSMGCACMNSNTYNYLISRGGNNTPYSEY